MRDGIDDEPSPVSRQLYGEHVDFYVDLARATGVKRADTARYIFDAWLRTEEGKLAALAVARYRDKKKRPVRRVAKEVSK